MSTDRVPCDLEDVIFPKMAEWSGLAYLQKYLPDPTRCCVLTEGGSNSARR
jgi:hypothetical protein